MTEVEMMNASIIRILCAGMVVSWLCMAHEPIQVHAIDDAQRIGREDVRIVYRGTLIAQAGGIHSILGPQSKNIVVCRHGDNIAFIYGGYAYPYNGMDPCIAYSVNSGVNWTYYGPFSEPEPFLHPGVDGSADFCTNPGELYFVWQCDPGPYIDGDLKCMIEENVPSAPSLSSPFSLPNASGLNARLPSVALSPCDPYYVIITAKSSINASIYCWITTDGGYTWSDSIRMIDAIEQGSAPGHTRWGSGDYIFFNYLDAYDWHGTSIIYPHCVESIDGGWTWSQPAPMPEVTLLDTVNTQFWWTELDCEVINDEPWAVHNDINQFGPDSGGFWIFHAEGSPGNWSWEIYDINELGACSTYLEDTLFYCSPHQYPSVAYDPLSNTILIAYKADFLKVCGTDTLYAGPHIGGIYTTDNGATWTTCSPLCETHANEISWDEWSATEVAHRLVNIDGSVYSYAVWINEMTMEQFFEKGMISPFVPVGIDEHSNSAVCAQLYAAPTIIRDKCDIRFSLNTPARTVIDLYDATGRFVKNVFDGNYAAGTYDFEIRLSDMPTGVYFVHLDTGAYPRTVKILVAR